MDKNCCINCALGCTMETSHEWIETQCEYRDWHNPFDNACEHFVKRGTKEEEK